jgi:hypothetical protein
LGTKITLPFFMLFFVSLGIAQSRKQIYGKISVVDASPSNVLVLNLNTQQEVKSDQDGLFLILAQLDDVLAFSSQNLDYMRKIVEQTDLEQNIFTIKMTSKRIVLDEVEVKSYNAVDLGILQRPAKSYTTMERRLRTAGDFKPIHLLALIGGGMPLDPVFNAINGKTKRLKKEIKLEQSQKRLEQFQALFPKEDLMVQVNINPERIMEFTYFILEEEEFKTLLYTRDKNKMLFYLIQNYTKFQNIKQLNENK